MFDRDPDKNDRLSQAGPPSGSWSQAGSPAVALPGAQQVVVAREGYLTMSFFWMFLALLVSAVTAFLVMGNARALGFVAQNFFILVIAELAFVFLISLAINRLGAIPALGLLFAYAVLNGATMSLIVLGYLGRGNAGISGVLSAFLGASAIFGGAALYGVVTKRDLTKLGGILFMGLLGLIVVSLVNAFLVQSNTMTWLISIVGVGIFTALTAYDVQRINNGSLGWIKTREAASVVGALALYLDFVNLFLMLLRLFNPRD
ncbi:MAG TPA: Bax inhibitor-1/YccA family protein [Candidatus Limnocylindrales bacterium]|nr:Bax inhibitor-1/YccA family protein [Candidatus Limnocylindrales bacterium]